MKQTISPILGIGLLLFAVYLIVDRFITPIPNEVALPILVVAILLIIVGVIKTKNK